MFRWSTAKINDAQMISEFSKFIFDVPHKGLQLRCCLNLATGDGEIAIQNLKEYIETTRSQLQVSRIKNKKNLKYL
jgi:hypothetical protein